MAGNWDFGKMNTGQVLFAKTPCKRFAVVDGKDTAYKHKRDSDGEIHTTTIKLMRVKCTIPCLAVEGYVTEKDAEHGLRIVNGLRAGDNDHSIWFELWAKRVVGVVEQKNGMPVISEKKFRDQIYVHHMTDLDGKTICCRDADVEGSRLESSGIHGKEVVAKLIKPAVIQGDVFEAIRGQAAGHAVPPEGTTVAEDTAVSDELRKLVDEANETVETVA